MGGICSQNVRSVKKRIIEVHNKKIFIFAKLPPPYTGQTIGTEVVSDQISNEKEVRLINTSYGKIKPQSSKLRSVLYSLGFSVLFLFKLFILWRRIKKYKGGTVYAIGSPTLAGHIKNLLTVFVAKKESYSVVLHIRNGNFQKVFESENTKQTAKWLKDNIDNFIFLSESLSRRLDGHITDQKKSVVRNTIDKKVRCSFKEVEKKISKRMNRKCLRVVYLSNMIESKGYKDLARAAVELLKYDTTFNVHFDFVGDWPNPRRREEFEAFLRDHKIFEDCNVCGCVEDRVFIKDILVKSDVFALPTYYPNEAQPRSIIEAFNAGTPVVSTRHASIPDYVFDGENGFLVSKRAPGEIAEALRSLTDVKEWKDFAHGARSTYEDMFSPAAIRSQMLSAL